MKVSAKTKWQDIEPLWSVLTDKSIEAVKAAALRHYGFGDLYKMTVSQLIEIAGGDLSGFALSGDGSAYEHVFVESLRIFVTQVVEILASYSVPQTADEILAAKACAESSLAEGLLIFVRGYFGLQSFEAAGKVTVADLIIAKKDSYNSAVFQRALTKKMLKK